MRAWATDTREVLFDEEGKVRGISVVDLDWSAGRPDAVEGSEHVIEAQLVLVACGFVGPERGVLDALGVSTGERGLPVCVGHRAEASGDTPVFVAGDVRSGSSLVVNAIADAMACAAEAATDLGL